MKYLKLLVVTVLMLSVVSCANDNSNIDNSGTEEASAGFTQSQTSEASTQAEAGTPLKKVYNRIDNITPKDELIKTEYSLESLQKKFARNGWPTAGYSLAIEEIEDTFPIECIRKLSEKLYYIVYKVKEGGYLFVHLRYTYEENWTGQNNGLRHTNSYYKNGKSRIKKIKKGDPFSKVADCDENIVGNNFNYLHEFIDGEAFYRSIHIESDKLYYITYNEAKSIDELAQSTVKSIDISSDLTITLELFKEYDYSYNYDILDIDK